MKIASEMLAHPILKALALEMGRAYSAAREWDGKGQVHRRLGLDDSRQEKSLPPLEEAKGADGGAEAVSEHRARGPRGARE